MAMRASGTLGRLVVLVGMLAVATPTPTLAQEATPAVAASGITLGAGELVNPRGFAWDEAGALHVALAGTGGTTMSGGDSAQEQADGPVMGGPSASVVRIDGGCGVPVASGLPSTRGMSGHDQGPAAVAFLGGQMYVLQDAAGGMEDVDPNRPNGVYAVNPDGSVRLVADLTAWINANPVAHVPYDQTTLGEPFAMVADAEALWVVEANNGQVLRVTPDGAIVRVADLSAGHPVPTAIALAPDGGAYVGFLTPAPYVDGSSKIVKVGADGTVGDVWTGLTMVTGVAVGPDGALYALEMATGNVDQPPYTTFGTGRVVRQTGPAAMAEVATGLDYPIAMAFGPDGGLYVATPAFGGDEEPGGIVRLDLSAGQPLVMPGGLLESSTCAPADGAATPAAAPAATAAPATSTAEMAMPTETATAVPAQTAATPEPNDGGKGATGSLAVTIQNFAFNPATLSVPAGTVVTWTNRDTVPHTATSTQGTFDSGNLNPGESFSYTFGQAGSFEYVCQYHANMRGTIVVTAAAVPAGADSASPQAATPAASGDGVSVVASGLHSPRGLAWDADGAFYVAQAGTGETATSVGAAASLVRIDGGCPVQVATGLPSSFDPFRDVLGPEDVAVLDGTLYVLQGATGLRAQMDPNLPNGVYAVEPNGSFRLVADLTTWITGNPVAHTPGDANELGEPYKLLPGDGFLWVLESNRGEVLRVGLDGTVSRVADLSAGHHVLTGFALAPDGGVYVGTLTPAPHPDGGAKVMAVTPDGQVSDVWTGLTTVTGLAVGADGTLYAVEMATGNSAEGEMFAGTGRLVRQTGPDQAEPVVTGLEYPIGLRLGPDAAAYVVLPAYGPNAQAGAVVRVDLTAPGPVVMDSSLLAGATCPGAQAYVPPAAPVAATPAAAATTEATPAAAAAGGVQVDIQNFAFYPAALSVAAGTTVTWTNNDTVPHTVTATDGSFNSGNLNPGQSFSFTFGQTGSFDYVCQYHPNMQASVTVA